MGRDFGNSHFLVLTSHGVLWHSIREGTALPAVLRDPQAEQALQDSAKAKKLSKAAKRRRKKLGKIRNAGQSKVSKIRTKGPVGSRTRAQAREEAAMLEGEESATAANSAPLAITKFIPQVNCADADLPLRLVDSPEKIKAVASDQLTNPERAQFLLSGNPSEPSRKTPSPVPASPQTRFQYEGIFCVYRRSQQMMALI